MNQEKFITRIFNSKGETLNLPKPIEIENFINSLLSFLFPSLNNSEFNELSDCFLEFDRLKKEFEKLINGVHLNGSEISKEFFEDKLELIYEELLADALAIEDGDPAATSKEEVMRTYPGFYAITIYRIANQLDSFKIPYIPRMLTEIAHSKTGIDIHPAAKIGKNFFIDHGTGIVIGETTIIGNNVKIYQGVTLGALSVKKEMAATKRHPSIEDNVVIYAGATILGGETKIGKNSTIGGNVWLTESVEENSLVYHKTETIIKKISKNG